MALTKSVNDAIQGIKPHQNREERRYNEKHNKSSEHWEITDDELTIKNPGGITKTKQEYLKERVGEIKARKSNFPYNTKFDMYDDVFDDVKKISNKESFLEEILEVAAVFGMDTVVEDNTIITTNRVIERKRYNIVKE